MNSKKKILTITLLIMMLLTALVNTQIVHAEMYFCGLCQEEHNLDGLSGPQATAVKWNDNLYNGDWFGKQEKGSKITVNTVLEFNVQGSGANSNFVGMWTQAETFYNAIKPVGIVLAVAWALMELLEQVASDRVNPELVVRSLIKILVSVIMINNGFELCTLVLGLATAAFNSLSEGAAGLNADRCLFKTAEYLKSRVGVGLLDMSGLYIPQLILLLAKFIITIMCWTRTLDIMIRVVLAPVGLSDIMVTGTNGMGFAFLKKLGTSALQGAITIGVMYAYSEVVKVIETVDIAGLPEYFMIIVATFVTIVSIFKANTYASDIIQ